MSLYFVTVSRLGRENRSLGQRIPRYQKIVQVPPPPPGHRRMRGGTKCPPP